MVTWIPLAQREGSGGKETSMSGWGKTFSEISGENWSEEREKLLQRKISELGLKLEGTRLEKLVKRLYQELEAADIRLRRF